ncbi:hypothetical protein [Undibacterium pigrum]|uniref:Aromatic-ring opening dioxygenase LigAB LigA subunit n=1 Tax=Undibacterium pigrum TaxID=401470 RepID=A0A318IUC0_9BURK|nr:hypothetical protein [Undibacterium pigrum]PXX39756.1 hypothetical protein DFR42_110122 [Undibacterium pigrum]
MSKLLDYLNALDTNAMLIQAHKSDPLKTSREFGLSHDEQQALVLQDKQKIAAFLDIPFRDFDAIDSLVGHFDADGNQKSANVDEAELVD